MVRLLLVAVACMGCKRDRARPVPALRDGKLRQLVYRDWWLRMGKSVGK